MAFIIIRDGMFSTIEKTGAPPDDLNVFRSFTAARKRLCDELSEEIDDLISAKRRIRVMRAGELLEEL